MSVNPLYVLNLSEPDPAGATGFYYTLYSIPASLSTDSAPGYYYVGSQTEAPEQGAQPDYFLASPIAGTPPAAPVFYDLAAGSHSEPKLGKSK